MQKISIHTILFQWKMIVSALIILGNPEPGAAGEFRIFCESSLVQNELHGICTPARMGSSHASELER